jgi:hypothetical protein
MMRIVSIIILISSFPLGFSFIFDSPLMPLNGLPQLVEAQYDRRISVALDIGKKKETSRLPINGIIFDLTKTTPSSGNEFVKMPGVNGPLPKLSGGIHGLNLVQDGSFVSMDGNTIVHAQKGCWEIVWKEGSPTGSLVVGFEIDQEYKRNEIALPKGKIYLSFSIWTREGLKEAQNNKERVLSLADVMLKEKDEELIKMTETGNVFEKVLHYYKAVSAVEKYSMEPVKKMNMVPNEDEVVPFDGNSFVSTKGTVWTQDLPRGQPTIIGNASLKSAPKEV